MHDELVAGDITGVPADGAFSNRPSGRVLDRLFDRMIRWLLEEEAERLQSAAAGARR